VALVISHTPDGLYSRHGASAGTVPVLDSLGGSPLRGRLGRTRSCARSRTPSARTERRRAGPGRL